MSATASPICPPRAMVTFPSSAASVPIGFGASAARAAQGRRTARAKANRLYLRVMGEGSGQAFHHSLPRMGRDTKYIRAFSFFPLSLEGEGRIMPLRAELPA